MKQRRERLERLRNEIRFDIAYELREITEHNRERLMNLANDFMQLTYLLHETSETGNPLVGDAIFDRTETAKVKLNFEQIVNIIYDNVFLKHPERSIAFSNYISRQRRDALLLPLCRWLKTAEGYGLEEHIDEFKSGAEFEFTVVELEKLYSQFLTVRYVVTDFVSFAGPYGIDLQWFGPNASDIDGYMLKKMSCFSFRVSISGPTSILFSMATSKELHKTLRIFAFDARLENLDKIRSAATAQESEIALSGFCFFEGHQLVAHGTLATVFTHLLNLYIATDETKKIPQRPLSSELLSKELTLMVRERWEFSCIKIGEFVANFMSNYRQLNIEDLLSRRKILHPEARMGPWARQKRRERSGGAAAVIEEAIEEVVESDDDDEGRAGGDEEGERAGGGGGGSKARDD